MTDAPAKTPKRRAPWIERHLSLQVRDPIPFDNPANFWRAISQVATLIMCLLMLGAFLYIARPFLLPVLCAFIVGLTFGPYIGRAVECGVPAWLLATAVVAAVAGVANAAIVLLADPLAEMLRRAPEIAAALKDRMLVFDQPILALQELQNAVGGAAAGKEGGVNIAQMLTGAVAVVTPVAIEFAIQSVLFVGTLFFFIVGRASFRQFTVSLFAARDARLRALKIVNDVEENLSGYLVVVTVINFCLGLVTMASAFAMGLPYPILWGALAFALNYIPYIGAGIVCLLLFGSGLMTFPTLTGALLPPAVFLAITTVEGQFLTPAIVGRRVLSLHPLLIFLSIAFWAWLWGPLGAFLATPILIVARAAFDHLYPRHRGELPD